MAVLIEFSSAVDALAAAIEFQQMMLEANRGQPEDMAIVFRIGLHLGDLIVDGDDLYGDAVNIAARLQEQAPAGGILVSRTVKEAVAGRMKATFEDRGRLELKNIERPIPAFRVIWDPRDWPVSTLVADVPAMDPPVGITSAGRPSTSARASLGLLAANASQFGRQSHQPGVSCWPAQAILRLRLGHHRPLPRPSRSRNLPYQRLFLPWPPRSPTNRRSQCLPSEI